jgi:hypothetical protein
MVALPQPKAGNLMITLHWTKAKNVKQMCVFRKATFGYVDRYG